MKPEELSSLKKWFSAYVAGFYTDDPVYNEAIHLKEAHTERVCHNICRIGIALGLSDEEMVLAETAALFHDLGRFKQYAVYGTFKDSDSENHARLSIREMALNKALAMCTPAERRYIVRAIAWHNAAALPETEEVRGLRLMRMLRDADKLDIWKVFAAHYQNRDNAGDKTLELGLPDEPGCSPAVLRDLRAGRFIRFGDLKTLNDFKLLQISWVFDLNFFASFQMAYERKDLEAIEASLPDSEEIRVALEAVHRYFNAVMEKGRTTNALNFIAKGGRHEDNPCIPGDCGNLVPASDLYSAQNGHLHMNAGRLSGDRQKG